jgi:tRNA(Ile)-lysidine synthase
MRGAHPEHALEQAIVRDGAIRRGDRVAIACSGGPDSIALAAALHAVAPGMELTLSIAHVNHGTRASAWQDECVVLRIAATFGVRCDVVALQSAGGGEAALRDLRYAALLESARRAGANVVATAHNAQDQTETVLLALFRGAGPAGTSAMRPRRDLGDGVELVRPLLRVAPEDLRHYCHVHALPYAVDPTNADGNLRRNAVRTALDALRPLFPGLDTAVARAAEIAGDEIDSTGRAALRRQVRERLAGQAELRDVDFEHVEAAVRTLERGGSGTFHMKAGLKLEIERGTIAAVERDP